MKMKLSILALMATLVIVNHTGSRGYSYRDVSLPVPPESWVYNSELRTPHLQGFRP